MAANSEQIVMNTIRIVWAPRDGREHAVRAAFVVGALCVSLALSIWAAHRLIADIYHNTSWQALNAMLEHRDRHPLSYYTAKVDRMVGGAHFLLALVATLVLTRGVQSPWLYLGILLIGDVVLGVLSERYGGVFSIRMDAGLPEIFQYVKEIMAGFLFIRLFRVTRQAMYMGFALLFAFLFLDDSLRYHERAGVWLAGTMDLSAVAGPLGVRTNDIGEIASAVLPVGVFGVLLAWGYWRANKEVRRVGRWVIFGVACLGFFGVIIDLVDRLPSLIEVRKTVAFIEDFGEMLIMSGIVAFAASVAWRTAGRLSDFRRAPRV